MKNLKSNNLKHVNGGNCIIRCQYVVAAPTEHAFDSSYEDFSFPDIPPGPQCNAKAQELKRSGGRGCLYCNPLTW